MKPLFPRILILCCLLLTTPRIRAENSGVGDFSVPPGTVENRVHPALERVLSVSGKLGIRDDEFVVFYFRNDGDYSNRALWLWRYPDGDGEKNFPFTGSFRVLDGVGYQRFRVDGSGIHDKPLRGKTGKVAFIVRKGDSWDEQTEDIVWDLESAGNRAVYFEGSSGAVPAAPYRPGFVSARASSGLNVVSLELTGRYGLDAKPGPSGFSVRTEDGKRTIAVLDAVNADCPLDRTENYANRILLTLAEDLPLDAACLVRHPAFITSEPIDASALVAAKAEQTMPPEGYRLGAVYDRVRASVEFRLWAPTARAVSVRLWEKSVAVAPSAAPCDRISLILDSATGVWHGSFSRRDPAGMFYDYQVTSSKGEKSVPDPYSMSMDAYRDDGVDRSAIIDLAASEPDGGWENTVPFALKRRTDAVIYEISVRDFTASPDSLVESGLRGTYLGLIAKLDYLKSLGVTHIQLQPVGNFLENDELNREYEEGADIWKNNYFWGYAPHNWFAPEGWYATDPADPLVRVRELKTLIREIHRAGMGVILDVVFNHLGDQNLYDDIVPGYYIRKDARGKNTTDSGVNNDIETSRAMSRRMIVDSLVHWTREYRVDGFRFDLMGQIDAATVLDGYRRTSAINPSILFEGEGWKNYSGMPISGGMMDQGYMTRTSVAAVFNDELRDLLRPNLRKAGPKGFLTGKAVPLERLYLNLTGRPRQNYTTDESADSMLYIGCHDDLELPDAIALAMGIDERSAAGREEIARRVKLGNFLILTGQGIPFLHGGQESLGSKPNLGDASVFNSDVAGRFVASSYHVSDAVNRYVWTRDEVSRNLEEFTRGLIAIRRANEAFHMNDPKEIAGATALIPQADPFAFSYSITLNGETWFVLANGNESETVFNLGRNVSRAAVLVDGNSAAPGGIANPQGVRIRGSKVVLQGLSPALLKLGK